MKLVFLIWFLLMSAFGSGDSDKRIIVPQEKSYTQQTIAPNSIVFYQYYIVNNKVVHFFVSLNEENLDYFQLQESKNLVFWKDVMWWRATGYSEGYKKYLGIQQELNPESIYFKLIEVDNSGNQRFLIKEINYAPREISLELYNSLQELTK